MFYGFRGVFGFFVRGCLRFEFGFAAYDILSFLFLFFCGAAVCVFYGVVYFGLNVDGVAFGGYFGFCRYREGVIYAYGVYR